MLLLVASNPLLAGQQGGGSSSLASCLFVFFGITNAYSRVSANKHITLIEDSISDHFFGSFLFFRIIFFRIIYIFFVSFSLALRTWSDYTPLLPPRAPHRICLFTYLQIQAGMAMMLPSLMPTVLLTLPAMAAAFIHLSIKDINRHHVPRDSIFMIHHTSPGGHTVMRDDGCHLTTLINELLMDNQLELLSNASQRQKLHPQSTVAADNENRGLAPQQMVQEILLSSRLHLPFLSRTKVGPSNIVGAGRGLFATENIAKGEIITCYPGDALLYELPLPDNETNNMDDESEDELSDYDEDDEDGAETIVLWGSHVPPHDIWDEDKVFDGNESTIPLTSYAVSVDDHYSVMGHPSLDDDPAYYGHFANDGAGHLALEGPNSQNNLLAAIELGLDTTNEEFLGAEENIAAYVLKSLEVANAWHKSLGDGSHVVTVATRDIEAGEEILVTYGPDYWLGHS